MFIKLYFDDKPLFLTDERTAEIEDLIHHDDAVFIDELDSHTVKTMLHEMQQPSIHAGIFLHDDFGTLKSKVFKRFKVIPAGGGLIFNDKNEILLMFRRGKWDFPKGKLDKGETIEECAVREVEEETGLKDVHIDKPLVTTYHTYQEGTTFVIKESHWFKMTAPGDQQLIPQTEEDIDQIKWVSPSSIHSYLDNAVSTMRDILKAGLPE